MTLTHLFARFLVKHPHVATSHIAVTPKPARYSLTDYYQVHTQPNRHERRAQLRRMGVRWQAARRLRGLPA